jgi:ethanolamine utilization protein EutA
MDAGDLPWSLLPASECIWATALGASEYTVQLSGNTTYISDPGKLLPRRNLQILQPPIVFEETIDPAIVAAAIKSHRMAFDLIVNDGVFGLAFRWTGAPSYQRISALAEGIRLGLVDRIARREPVFVMLDGDIAQSLGAILREEMSIESEVLVIDGVTLWDFDFVDLGRIRLPSRTVPVTIKSLVFKEDPRGPRSVDGLSRSHGHGHRHNDDDHSHDQHHEHAHGDDHHRHGHHHHDDRYCSDHEHDHRRPAIYRRPG